MPLEFDRPHQALTFMAPLSPLRADALVRFAADGLRGDIVDVGCGWAELLLRTVAMAPEASGIGVDIDPDAIEQGRIRAAERRLSDRVRLVVGDARTQARTRADAVICVGSSQIWGPAVEEHQPLDYSSALTALRGMVDRGARVVYGEAIWSRPPTPEAIAPLAGRIDEFVALPRLVELSVAAGFAPMAVHEASLDEWDEFESGYSARYAAWLARHGAQHSDARDVLDRAAAQRRAYFGGYRGVLGMAYLALVAV